MSGSRQHHSDEDRTYQMESALRWSIGSRFSSRYTSVVKETSVSWAELKLVTVRPGMPKHRKTDTETDWYGVSGQYLRDVNLSWRHVRGIESRNLSWKHQRRSSTGRTWQGCPCFYSTPSGSPHSRSKLLDWFHLRRLPTSFPPRRRGHPQSWSG